MSTPVLTGTPQAPGIVQHGTYYALVQDDNDLIGLVAYAFYKREKLKFCASFQTKHGRPASTAEIDTFIQSANLDTRVKSYRAEAETLLERVTEIQLEDIVEQIKQDAYQELARELAKPKSWRRVGLEAIFGSVVVALVWAGIAWGIYFNKVGSDKLIKDAIGVETQPPAEPPGTKSSQTH